jgi:hypothetical protein
MLVAVVCMLWSTLIFYEILDEVNAKRPLSQQISPIFVNLKTFDILSQHVALFPSSQKRKQMYILGGVGVALIFSAFPSCITWLLPLLPARLHSSP